MAKTTVQLVYPNHAFDKPLISQLVKEYDVVFNILRADFGEDRRGRLTLALTGTTEHLEQGLAFLREQGVTVMPMKKNILWNKDKCVECGACTAVCPKRALYLDGQTLHFDASLCIACEKCLSACPLRAMDVRLFE